MGGGSGAFSDEVWEAHLATMTPIRRDTTVLGAIPGNGTVYRTPEGDFFVVVLTLGWRVFRWQPQNPGVWMLHCHIAGHMMLGLQTQIVVGTNADLPTLPEDYKGTYLSPGQTAAMGNNGTESDFIPYFISPSSPVPTTIGK
jgi:L-ascorbate oxidase